MSRDAVPADLLDKERAIYRAQMEDSKKPANIIDKIVEGKLGSYYEQVVLPDQQSIRDPKMTVADVMAARVQGLGATVAVTRFARLRVGETHALIQAIGRGRSIISLRDRLAAPAYKRVLLKLSGEALMGEQNYGIDPAVATQIAKDVAEIQGMGVETAIVIGGGNIFRGRRRERPRAWTARPPTTWACSPTIINALALQDALEQQGVLTRVVTAIEMRAVAEPFIRRRAIRHLEKGRVVVFGAGTGNPYFSTDTAAALRAMEIKADVILKATKVDGIYDADPMLQPTRHALRSHLVPQVLEQGLKVMDATAISLCMDNRLPIVVFNLQNPGQHQARHRRRADRLARHGVNPGRRRSDSWMSTISKACTRKSTSG